MKKIEYYNSKLKKPVCIALGYFDSIHLGHRALIDVVLNCAKKNNYLSAITTFGNSSEPQVLHLYQRLQIFKGLSLDYVLDLPATSEFKEQSPKEFIQKLRHSFCTRAIVVGHDFRFGKDRLGDVEMLKKLCAEHDIELVVVEPFIIDNNRVSTSLIKKHLQEGKIELANSLLGQSFSMHTAVFKGDGRGKALGYATANFEIYSNLIALADGVYKTQTIINDTIYNSLTHIGARPTFDASASIETHIIGFSGDLYYKSINVVFLKRLRDIIKFDSESELKAQIKKDLQQAWQV